MCVSACVCVCVRVCVWQAKCTSESEQELLTGRVTHAWCRLAAQAQHEDQTSWLYQASSLALTQAGQKALLHAGLPQQLLHQLYRLPMQSTDHDTDAMREQQHAKWLHACEVSVMSWRIITISAVFQAWQASCLSSIHKQKPCPCALPVCMSLQIRCKPCEGCFEKSLLQGDCQFIMQALFGGHTNQ